MVPTFKSGDKVLIKEDSNFIKNDIVFFKRPSQWNIDPNDSIIVKRIIATSGDTLDFDGAAFIINQTTRYSLPETYECTGGKVNYHTVLNDNQLFVLGDNTLKSFDSRRVFCDGNLNDFLLDKMNVLDKGKVIGKVG